MNIKFSHPIDLQTAMRVDVIPLQLGTVFADLGLEDGHDSSMLLQVNGNRGASGDAV